VKVGDLVKAVWGTGMTGVIVGWERVEGASHPLILWNDGSCRWITSFRVEVL